MRFWLLESCCCCSVLLLLLLTLLPRLVYKAGIGAKLPFATAPALAPTAEGR